MTTGKAALLSGYDHKRDMPYQSLIKAWLAEKVDAVSGASAVPGARFPAPASSRSRAPDVRCVLLAQTAQHRPNIKAADAAGIFWRSSPPVAKEAALTL
ncbi:MAG TPA: hypothetical protein VGA77_14350, partial [Propylenella sp.]